jgi:hypothetical protein
MWPIVWIYLFVCLWVVLTIVLAVMRSLLDWTVLVAFGVLAVVVLTALSNWRTFSRESYRHNTLSFGRVVVLLIAWTLILVVCVPADFSTLTLWRRRWKAS